MSKYIYLIPCGGLNDILHDINRAITYAKKCNRILLISGGQSCYQVDFDIFF